MASPTVEPEYDPFVRGPRPVGVQTRTLVDPARDDRTLPVEIWYPAGDGAFGLDLEPATQDRYSLLPGGPMARQAAVRDAVPARGPCPLIVFAHTSYGHRRQSTFLCTHLASHGYVVAAADHVGNTFGDWVARPARKTPLSSQEIASLVERLIGARVPDLRLVGDALVGGSLGALPAIDPARIGLVGWSFGGWSVLAVPEVDARVGAVVALTPGGASKPLPGIIPSTLTFAWHREVDTLILAAERDRFTPLDGVREVFGRAPDPKRIFVLRFADHDHFGDHIEVPLVPPDQARLFTRSLVLAHLDAALADRSDARRFLDLAGQELAARGIAVVGP